MSNEASRKQTCVPCRKRKVRCDGDLSGCSNCKRLDFSCLFLQPQNAPEARNPGTPSFNLPLNQPSSTASGPRTKYTIGGIERRRGLRACRPCRASKSRCSGGWPKCRHCQQRGLDCQYLPSKRRRNIMTDAAFSATIFMPPNESGIALNAMQSMESMSQSKSLGKMNSMADKIFLETHINVFFDYFNAIPQYNFIHKATFLRSFYHDTLDPLFLRCVCGVASRFLRPRSAPEYVVEWLKEVEAQIWSRMGEMKLQNLQILVLLICWYLMERKISNMWIASGVAARMAYGIRLNYETSDKIPFLSRELRRRLMWSIFMLDKLYAGGFTELVLCSPSTMHIKLPCEERNFELDMTVETPILEPARPDSQLESNIGIMGYITRLMNIRHAVLEITKQIISSNANPYSAQDSIQSLDNMLNSFALSLPAHLRDSPRNLLCRAYTSELAGYINLHTLWHQCYCDLYRMMIPGIRESVPELVQRQVPVEYADECRRLCLHHAVGMCKLWSDTLREADISRISDQSIGIYAYQCANVLVNLWDLDRDDTLESSLQTISSFLDHLSLIYPVVAEVQLEVKSFISKLNVVADFYHTHAHQNLAPRLTAAWRSSLRQQGTQEGQTTSRFSLLEYLQNQNSAEDPGTPGEYCAAPVNDVPADPVPLPEVNIGMGLTADASSPDRPDLLTDELWPEESLVIDFDTDGTHVDPFSRIFGDWSLVTEPQSSLQEPPRH